MPLNRGRVTTSYEVRLSTKATMIGMPLQVSVCAAAGAARIIPQRASAARGLPRRRPRDSAVPGAVRMVVEADIVSEPGDRIVREGLHVSERPVHISLPGQ